MSEVTLGGRDYDAVTVVIGDHKFRTLPRTRKVVREMRPHAKALYDAQIEGDDDAIIEAMAAMFDVRLVPMNGSRKKASTVIVELWKKNELTREHLDDFADDIAEAERPT